MDFIRRLYQNIVIEHFKKHRQMLFLIEYFQKQTRAKHAFQVVLDAEYEEVDCFSYTKPVIVPAKTFLSQLV